MMVILLFNNSQEHAKYSTRRMIHNHAKNICRLLLIEKNERFGALPSTQNTPFLFLFYDVSKRHILQLSSEMCNSFRAHSRADTCPL